jgi:hypothetical protein
MSPQRAFAALELMCDDEESVVAAAVSTRCDECVGVAPPSGIDAATDATGYHSSCWLPIEAASRCDMRTATEPAPVSVAACRLATSLRANQEERTATLDGTQTEGRATSLPHCTRLHPRQGKVSADSHARC